MLREIAYWRSLRAALLADGSLAQLAPIRNFGNA
jgi:hypothetical protein